MLKDIKNRINLVLLWILLISIIFALIGQIVRIAYGEKLKAFQDTVGYNNMQANTIAWMLGAVAITIGICIRVYSVTNYYDKTKLYYWLLYLGGAIGLVLIIILITSSHKDHLAPDKFKTIMSNKMKGFEYEKLSNFGKDAFNRYNSLADVYVPILISSIMAFLSYFGNLFNEYLEREGWYEKTFSKHKRKLLSEPKDTKTLIESKNVTKSFDSFVDKLTKSKALLDKGIISKEEFEKIKAKELEKHF